MAGNALEMFEMSLRFDQYHNKDHHDGREALWNPVRISTIWPP